MSTPVPPLFTADRSDRGLLRLTGKDRQTFLQGMVTNDVASLTPGSGCYAFLLDATGHVLADARVVCGDGYLLLDVEPGMAPFVADTLERYLIMEKVRIADVTEDTGRLLVGGTAAPGFLAELGVENTAAWGEGGNATVPAVEGLLAASTRLTPEPAFDIYGPPDAVAEVASHLAAAGAVRIEPSLLEALRIEAGVPRFGVDIDARVLAPETGQRARAIHYRKGCYIGQEIVARIDARGHTNRSLAGLFVAEAGIDADTPIFAEGREVGRVTSSAVSPRLGRPIALGYLRHEFSEPGTAVTVDGQEATVAALPFVALTSQ